MLGPVVGTYVLVRVFLLIFWNWVIKTSGRCWHEFEVETTKLWGLWGHGILLCGWSREWRSVEMGWKEAEGREQKTWAKGESDWFQLLPGEVAVKCSSGIHVGKSTPLPSAFQLQRAKWETGGSLWGNQRVIARGRENEYWEKKTMGILCSQRGKGEFSTFGSLFLCFKLLFKF